VASADGALSHTALVSSVEVVVIVHVHDMTSMTWWLRLGLVGRAVRSSKDIHSGDVAYDVAAI
jgi:hypothetical protein